MPVLLGSILSRAGAIFGSPVGLVSVAAGIALLVLGAMFHFSQNRVAAANRTIGQLNGTILFQNARITTFEAAVMSAQKRAAAATKVADAKQAAGERTITELLNRPLAPPELACKAADDVLLEFAR